MRPVTAAPRAARPSVPRRLRRSTRRHRHPVRDPRGRPAAVGRRTHARATRDGRRRAADEHRAGRPAPGPRRRAASPTPSGGRAQRCARLGAARRQLPALRRRARARRVGRPARCSSDASWSSALAEVRQFGRGLDAQLRPGRPRRPRRCTRACSRPASTSACMLAPLVLTSTAIRLGLAGWAAAGGAVRRRRARARAGDPRGPARPRRRRPGAGWLGSPRYRPPRKVSGGTSSRWSSWPRARAPGCGRRTGRRCCTDSPAGRCSTTSSPPPPPAPPRAPSWSSGTAASRSPSTCPPSLPRARPVVQARAARHRARRAASRSRPIPATRRHRRGRPGRRAAAHAEPRWARCVDEHDRSRRRGHPADQRRRRPHGLRPRAARRPTASVTRVVEHKDATADELAVTEVATSVYAFDHDAAARRRRPAVDRQRAGRGVPARRRRHPGRRRAPRRRGGRAGRRDGRRQRPGAARRRAPRLQPAGCSRRTCGPGSPSSTRRRPGSTPTSPSNRTSRCCPAVELHGTTHVGERSRDRPADHASPTRRSAPAPRSSAPSRCAARHRARGSPSVRSPTCGRAPRSPMACTSAPTSR